MAKVIAPLHSMQVRGAACGILFRRWRDLNTASGMSPTEGSPLEPAFILWREVANSWSSLDREVMEAWRAYARSHHYQKGPLKPKFRSGYITYCCAAYLAEECGESAPEGPPETVPPNYLDITYFGENALGNLWVRWDSGADGDFVQIKGSYNKPIGRRIYDYAIAQKGFYSMGTGEATYLAAVAGKRSRVKGRIIRSNGQAGQWAYKDFYT